VRPYNPIFPKDITQEDGGVGLKGATLEEVTPLALATRRVQSSCIKKGREQIQRKGEDISHNMYLYGHA